MPPKSDHNAAGSETSEFPILCETCLGPNPYVRMSKQPLGKACKICTRPFTVFRWNPGQGRFKKTEICNTCAKIRNVCATCILDLEFGLPSQIRDIALGRKNEAPTSDINKQYYAQNMERELADSTTNGAGSSSSIRSSSTGKEMLKAMAKTDPSYSRNRAHVCSFYAKGECARGGECPYRHEKPASTAPAVSASKSIADRYHGLNDPVAKQLLRANAAQAGLTPPADESITTLLLLALPPTSEEAVRAAIFAKLPSLGPTELKSVIYVSASNCAFLNFTTRSQAERAAGSLGAAGGVELAGKQAKLVWGRARKPAAGAAPAASTTTTAA